MSSLAAVGWVSFHCLIVLCPLTSFLFNGPHVEGGRGSKSCPLPSLYGASFTGTEECTNMMKKYLRFTRLPLAARKRRKLNRRALNRHPLQGGFDTNNNHHCVPSSWGTWHDCKACRPVPVTANIFIPTRLNASLGLGKSEGFSSFSSKFICDLFSMQIRHTLHNL